MKKAVITLCIGAFCLSASGQFFSEAEKAKKAGKEQKSQTAQISVSKQKEVYKELCQAKVTADQKAEKLHPIQILQVPEKRKEQEEKAIATSKNLMGLYKTKIAEKHHLSEKYLEEIWSTGQEKKWANGIKEPQKK